MAQNADINLRQIVALLFLKDGNRLPDKVTNRPWGATLRLAYLTRLHKVNEQFASPSK